MAKILYRTWNKKGTNHTDRKDVGSVTLFIEATDNIYDRTNTLVADTLDLNGEDTKHTEIRLYHKDGREWVGTFDELTNKVVADATKPIQLMDKKKFIDSLEARILRYREWGNQGAIRALEKLLDDVVMGTEFDVKPKLEKSTPSAEDTTKL